METVDPALISQLSRRKLRGSAYDEQRRDKHNLRRLVLIQNSLVSISPCPSPSRTSPAPDDACECENDATQDANQHTHGDHQYPAHHHHHSEPASYGGESILYDDDGFGYIFPDLSLYNEDSDDDEEEDEDDFGGDSHADAEADWLDAVLSDLDEEDEPRDLSSSTGSQAASPSSIPIRTIHTPYGSGPRYPLPRPTISMNLDALASPVLPAVPDADVDADRDIDDSTATLDDALPPYFDPDDRSSVYSDESSEPSTPLSNSLLRSGLPSHPSFPHNHSHSHHHQHQQPRSSILAHPDNDGSENSGDHHIGVVAHSRHSLAQSYSEARAHGSGLGDDTANRTSRAMMNVNGGSGKDELEEDSDSEVLGARALLKTMQAQQRQREQQRRVSPMHDYFACHFSGRPFDTF